MSPRALAPSLASCSQEDPNRATQEADDPIPVSVKPLLDEILARKDEVESKSKVKLITIWFGEL